MVSILSNEQNVQQGDLVSVEIFRQARSKSEIFTLKSEIALVLKAPDKTGIAIFLVSGYVHRIGNGKYKILLRR